VKIEDNSKIFAGSRGKAGNTKKIQKMLAGERDI